MIKRITKENIVTKSHLKKSLDDVIDAILQGMDNMFEEERKYNNEKFASKKDLIEVNDKLDAIQTDISWTKDNIDGLKYDLSTTATKKEFRDLKDRVDLYLSPN